jgi:acyl carrier protein
MKKNEFVKLLTEYCEFEDQGFTLDTVFKSIEEYDSMSIMAIIAFTDEKFNLKLTAQQLMQITDFKSLVVLIGEDKFEND